MKNFDFKVVPLSTEAAEAARRSAAVGMSNHAMIIADSAAGYPCRHCLRFARPGEHVILFTYASIPPGHPYSESGPIFVHADRCERYDALEYPADLRNGRVFRAYNANYDMIDAEVVNGSEPEVVIEKLFQNPETAFVHAHSAIRGCYTFGVERI